jgi:hypothetical protein
LNPVDPQLKGAWHPGGFNPCTYQVKTRFQSFPFKYQLVPLRRGHNCEWGLMTCAWAASKGDLDMLIWLRENNCPWDWMTCEEAATNGHLVGPLHKLTHSLKAPGFSP